MAGFDHSFDPDDDPHGGDDGTDEGWGSPEDLAAVVRAVQALPPGVEPWGLEDDEGLPTETDVTDSELRAALNEELGFYPARLDDESVAEYRRAAAEQGARLARYDRDYATPGGSHYNQFKHLNRKEGDPEVHGSTSSGQEDDDV